MKTITKAVIPVAGLGTRFLPATKLVPKELLPIVDKPSLQYVVEEAVAAGVHNIAFISNPAKSQIESHFKSYTVYDELLKRLGKHHLLKDLNELNKYINISTIFQLEAMGLGHAVSCAREFVGNDWFVLLLPDMLIDAEKPCTAQMIDVWKETGKGVIATGHAEPEMISQYGIIAPDKTYKNNNSRVYKVQGLVEKPKLEEAPSDLYIIGRYLLPPTIFDYLEKAKAGKNGEIQITDSLQELAQKDGLFAYEFEGVLHDTGDKLEYLKANLYYSMKHAKYRGPLLDYIKTLHL